MVAIPDQKDTRPARPFLKWAGGKTRLLSRLLPFVPSVIQNYHEPFLGGGAMFFAIAARVRGVSYLSDLNDELINAWLAVRDDADELRNRLRRYKRRDSEEFFYSLRSARITNPIERAARFVYLNQTAWNGLWRVNRWGEFNVPWGQRSFRGLSASQLATLQGQLHETEIGLLDFRDALRRAQRGDFVYLDPPYLPLSDTSKFYLYTERRFREPDLRDLATLCRELSRKHVSWVLSNRDTPLVRELFAESQITTLTARRSVAAQNRRNVEAIDSPEVIIVGPEPDRDSST
jgi:DNA adenine methylase